MAVVSVDEIWQGRDGEDTLEGARSATQVFRVITDDRKDGHVTVGSDPRLPRLGSPHPEDPSISCIAVQPRNDSVDGRIWLVTIAYANSSFETFDNPLNDAAIFTWGTETYQRPATQDRYGNPISNSLGDRYDPPPMIDDSRAIVNIAKNYSAIPSWILTYSDCVNSDSIEIDGVSISPRVAKVQRVGVSEALERNFISFRTLNITIQLKAETWDFNILNEGTRYLLFSGGKSNPSNFDSITKNPKFYSAINTDGTYGTTLLKLNGNKLDNMTDPSESVFITYRIYEEKAFSGIIPTS